MLLSSIGIEKHAKAWSKYCFFFILIPIIIDIVVLRIKLIINNSINSILCFFPIDLNKNIIIENIQLMCKNNIWYTVNTPSITSVPHLSSINWKD